MSRILGIDPGVKGAFALIDTIDWTIAVTDMPLEAGVKGKDMVSARGIINLVQAARPDSAFLEKVSASPQMGVTSAFSFGDGYGCTRTGILAYNSGAGDDNGCALWLIRPQDWKPAMKAPKDKKASTTRAAQLVPSAHKILFGPRGGAYDGRGEAIMLALYGCLHLKTVPPRPLSLIDFPQE